MVTAMNDSIGYRALVWLNREQKRAKRDLWYAEQRNATQEELCNLNNKMDVLDWLIGLAIKEDDTNVD